MPTQFLYRVYCTNCMQYELHKKQLTIEDVTKSTTTIEQFRCIKCDNVFNANCHDVRIELSIVQEQRRRWRLSKLKKLQMYSQMMLQPYQGLFDEVGIDTCIIESDAGASILKKELDKQIELLAVEYNEKLKGWVKCDRNAQCFCGSGKKFKKCCINKVDDVNKEFAKEANKLNRRFDIDCYGIDFNRH